LPSARNPTRALSGAAAPYRWRRLPSRYSRNLWFWFDLPLRILLRIDKYVLRIDKYVVRRAGPMVELASLAARRRLRQIWFIGWMRRDGSLLDAGSHPVKALKQAEMFPSRAGKEAGPAARKHRKP
jgi:hypothetical protein